MIVVLFLMKYIFCSACLEHALTSSIVCCCVACFAPRFSAN